MGMKSVRMSRKDHPMPTMKAVSPRAASKYADEGYPSHPEKHHSVHSMVPKKNWPSDDLSAWTPPPQSYARTTGVPGKIRGRQSDKSSKTK